MFFGKPKLKVAGIYQLYGPVLYHESDIGLDTSTTRADDACAAMVMDHVKAWCIRNEFLTPGGVTDVTQPAHSFVMRIFSLNFRTLVHAKELDSLVKFLKDTEDDHTMNRILALHTSLIAIGDVGYLTKLINKLYHSLALVSPSGDKTWPQIHRTFPYFWVLWLIQLVITQYTPSLPKGQ